MPKEENHGGVSLIISLYDTCTNKVCKHLWFSFIYVKKILRDCPLNWPEELQFVWPQSVLVQQLWPPILLDSSATHPLPKPYTTPHQMNVLLLPWTRHSLLSFYYWFAFSVLVPVLPNFVLTYKFTSLRKEEYLLKSARTSHLWQKKTVPVLHKSTIPIVLSVFYRLNVHLKFVKIHKFNFLYYIDDILYRYDSQKKQ
jgi:hypothetical protein